MPESRLAQGLIWAAVIAAAAIIIIVTGRTPSRLAYEAALKRATTVVHEREKVNRQRFEFGSYERFDWSQDHGLIVFSNAGGPQVVADIQFVGSYSDTSKTWLWAWANDAIVPEMKRDSLRVREFGRSKGLEKLMTPKWSATEADGWDMTYFQAYVAGAELTYRTPFSQGQTYLTLKNIRRVRPGEQFDFVPVK